MVVKAVVVRGITRDSVLPLEQSDPVLVRAVDVWIKGIGNVHPTAPKLTLKDWQHDQLNDPDIGPVVKLIQQKKHLQYKLTDNDSNDTKILLKYHKDLVLRDQLLYRKVQPKNQDTSVLQFVLPSKYRNKVMTAMHDDFGSSYCYP